MGSLGSRRVGERERVRAWVSVCVWFGLVGTLWKWSWIVLLEDSAFFYV